MEARTLQSLLEAARWAPSCFNEQPWSFLIWTKDDPASLESARSCLVEGNSWAKRAPILILTVARERFSRNAKPNRHAQYDTGQATENLVLQATVLGLVSHQMGGFDAAKAVQLFGIPEGHTPMAMIAIGHPGDPKSMGPEIEKRDAAPRTRRSQAEFAFHGRWGKAGL